MFLTVCLNPTLQKTLCFSSVKPGAVNRTAVHRLDASGKGINVTRVLKQLEKKALHLTHLPSCVADNVCNAGFLSPLFLSLCKQDGLAVEWVESNSQIRFCYTVIDESSGEVTELVEESSPVAEGTEQLLLEKFDIMLNHGYPLPTPHTLIISGTKAAGYSETVIPEMVRKAKEKGLRIILDIKGDDLKECLKYEPDIIKPNLDEFLETFGIGAGEARDTILELAQKHKCRVILTNGSRKILAAEGSNYFEVEIHPAPKNLGAGNTTGCGDAFTAGLAAALFPCGKHENGADFLTAINEGIRCGALNAGLLKPGSII